MVINWEMSKKLIFYELVEYCYTIRNYVNMGFKEKCKNLYELIQNEMRRTRRTIYANIIIQRKTTLKDPRTQISETPNHDSKR